MSNYHFSDQTAIYAAIKDLFNLIDANVLSVTVKFICFLIVIILNVIMFILIIRRILRRQENNFVVNNGQFLTGIYLSFSYLLVMMALTELSKLTNRVDLFLKFLNRIYLESLHYQCLCTPRHFLLKNNMEEY